MFLHFFERLYLTYSQDYRFVELSRLPVASLIMSQKGGVIEGRRCFVDAEKTPDRAKSVELYLKAAKNYLEAAREVEDDTLKRSLVYLSNSCTQKATTRSVATWKPVQRQSSEPPNYSETMESSRLLHLAHLQRMKGVEKIPRRSEATSFQVVKDMLSLEAALSSIGFKNPKASEKAAVPENLLRSTFAFTSDLGESFMVLDPKGQANNINGPQHQRSANRTDNHGIEARQRDPNRTVVQWNDTNVAESVVLPTQRRQGNPSTTRELHPRDVEQLRKQQQQQQQHSVKQEIENELNDPLVQSYLSTHAQSAMVRSQFDADNLSQSTITAFNKDTVDNAVGVLNLLQTVRRIGEENTQLLLRIEHLKHLEERSALVYKDIDSFKQEFAEKFDDLKDLLSEHVHSMAELHRKTSTNSSSSAGSAGVELPLRDPLSSVILQEIRARKEAAQAAAAKAEAETQEAKRGSGQGAGPGQAAASSSPAGIAEKSHEQGEGVSVVRQQQLEKMVKNILARLEKAQLEVKQKDALLEKYLRVISKLQQLRPKDESGEVEGLDMSMSSLTVGASSTFGTTSADDGLLSPNPGPGPKDASLSAGAGGPVGGVISTYRKPPSPSNASSAHTGSSHSQASAAHADVFGAPLPPSSIARTSSGGAPSTGLPPAGLSSPRKALNLPPRNKLPPNATTAMEFLQKNANK